MRGVTLTSTDLAFTTTDNDGTTLYLSPGSTDGENRIIATRYTGNPPTDAYKFRVYEIPPGSIQTSMFTGGSNDLPSK